LKIDNWRFAPAPVHNYNGKNSPLVDKWGVLFLANSRMANFRLNIYGEEW
jgi:hypothetical protein